VRGLVLDLCYEEWKTGLQMERTPIETKKEYILQVSILLSACVLSISIFRWTLVDLLTIFLEPLLEMAVGIVFLGVLTWSFYHFLRKRKTRGMRSGVPLLINACVLLIVVFVPFDAITTKVDFYANYGRRMKVVDDVLHGKMDKYVTQRGADGDMIHLPVNYLGLSSGGGDIIKYRRDGQNLILFYSFRGILRSFSGFVYVTGNATPQNGDFGENFFEIEKLKPNWYWVASKN
jgi:hypothetical protein